MRLGVIFPQTEIGPDSIAVRDFAQAAESLGYDHIVAYDHVVGAHPENYPQRKFAYTYKDQFHEPFVLFGYLAGLTKKIELATGIVILPQRQTVLVAKQAAAVDVLSAGAPDLQRTIGWNEVEYEVLGEDFHNRGRRSEEQVAVLKALWTNELVNFDGRWHTLRGVGINPLPIQRPIPLWFGGGDERVIQRVARLGDGWMPLFPPDERCRSLIEQMRSYVREAGRDPDAVGIEGRIQFAGKNPDQWNEDISLWKKLGATHLSLNTMKAGFAGPSAHIEAMRRFKETLSEKRK